MGITAIIFAVLIITWLTILTIRQRKVIRALSTIIDGCIKSTGVPNMAYDSTRTRDSVAKNMDGMR